MAETLGMLCDKITIVKLKQYHTIDEARLESLNNQAAQLQSEIDEYIADAFSGKIPLEKITFASNKVYREEGNETKSFEGAIGELIAQLAQTNCELWHEQEKVYAFDQVPVNEKDIVIKQLAVLNLERNQCIDKINNSLLQVLKNKNGN